MDQSGSSFKYTYRLTDLIAEQALSLCISPPEWDVLENREQRRMLSEISTSFFSKELKEGELSCVLISNKGSGKPVPYVYQSRTVDASGTTVVCFSPVGSVPHIVIYRTDATGSNKTASKLLGIPVKGSVIFILLDHDYQPTHSTVSSFKEFCSGYIAKPESGR